MSLLKYLLLLLFVKMYIKTQDVASPCPKVFYYGKELGQEVAIFEMLHKNAWSDKTEINGFKLELKFYTTKQTNADYKLVNITLKQDRMEVLQNIFRIKSITFQIYFKDEPLMLAEVITPSRFTECQIKSAENRSTVSAIYNLRYSDEEVEEGHKHFLKTGGLVQDMCDSSIQDKRWLASIQVMGVHKCTVIFIGQLRALTDLNCFMEVLEITNLNEIELVLYNNQVLKIWKYESMRPKYNPIIALLYIWPDQISEQVVTACLSTKFYKQSTVKNFSDSVIFFRDRKMPVNASNVYPRDRTEVLENHVQLSNSQFSPTDRGAPVMTKLDTGWYLNSIFVDYKYVTSDFIVFSNVNRVLSKIVTQKGQESPKLLIAPINCRTIFHYGNEHGRDIGFIEVEMANGLTFYFNLTLEFYVPADFYEIQKPLDISVRQNGVGFYLEQKFWYTLRFRNGALPLKRVLFNNEVKCEDTSDNYENNPTLLSSHSLITDPTVLNEYKTYIGRSIDEAECGKFVSESIETSYPWFAILFIEGMTYQCIVTMISKKIAVTSASCIFLVMDQAGNYKYKDEAIYVRLFNDDVIKVSQLNQRLEESTDLRKMLWLVFLEEEISAPEFVPICLWNDFEDISSGVFTHLVHNENNSTKMHQKQAVYRTILHEDCKHDSYPTDDDLFCAKPLPILRHSDLFKTAAPFMYRFRERWYLIGIFQRQVPYHEFYIFYDTTDYYYWFRNELAPVPVLRSNCQQFQYGEENGKNVAFLEIQVQRSQIYGFNVSLEFYLAKRDSIPSSPIEIKLQSLEDDLIEKILTRRPVTYLIIFPTKAFVIRRIFFSGILVCENQDDAFGRKPKTVTASHVFRPSIDVVGRFNRYIGQGINEEGCGNLKKDHKALSIAGERVDKKEWPWVVSMYIKDEHKCSGTLISKAVAVTAAHCLEPGGFSASASDVTLTLFNNKNINIWDFIMHPYYNGATANDIGLLLLNEDIQATDFVPICVWPFLEDVNNLSGTLVGFGATELQESGRINRLDMTAVPATICRASNEKLRKLVNINTFCAKGPVGTGPCQGDSGGGFVYEESGIWYLRGVVSASLLNDLGECDTENYAVFMNIEKYFDWIKNSNKTKNANNLSKNGRKSKSLPSSYYIGDLWIWTK